jgi:hypothetical protein
MNAPVLGPDGQIRFILHRVEDVTELTMGAALARNTDSTRLEVFLRGQELQEANRQLREATEQFQAMYEQRRRSRLSSHCSARSTPSSPQLL